MDDVVCLMVSVLAFGTQQNFACLQILFNALLCTGVIIKYELKYSCCAPIILPGNALDMMFCENECSRYDVL